LILTYLIPCRLITQHKIPTAGLLAEAPRLQRIFGPLVACIKRGDLTGFDKALADGEPEFVRRRIFLTLERSRDIALRNLLRKVYLAGGYDELKEGQTEKDRIRKSRIPLAHFATALRMGVAGGSGQVVEDDEVECLLANQIYKVRTQASCVHPCSIMCMSYTPSLCALSTHTLARQPCYADYNSLTCITGANEGLHLPRTRHGGIKQERRLPRNRGLMPKLICLSKAHQLKVPSALRLITSQRGIVTGSLAHRSTTILHAKSTLQNTGVLIVPLTS
jgi:hypothetical protein